MRVHERKDGEEGEVRGAEERVRDVGCDGRAEQDLDGGEDRDREEGEEECKECCLYD